MSDRLRFAYACALVLTMGACAFDHAFAPDGGSNGDVTVSFDGSATTTDEAQGTITIPVVLSAASMQTVTVSYGLATSTATRPDDFTLTDDKLTFLPGQVSQQITVGIANDAIEENDETIVVELSMPVGASLGAMPTYTVTISSDLLARVSFGDPTPSSALEAISPQVEIKLSSPPKEAVTVELGVAGSASTQDRGVTNGQVITFQANETSQFVPLGVVQDLLDEDDETINLTLQNPSAKLLLATTGITRSHTITDDDPLPTVGFAASTSMTNENQVIDLTVQLSPASGRMVTVGYTASFGTATSADATVTGAPGTVTFMPGQTSRTISVAVINDTIDEPNESLTVMLAGPGNAMLGTATNTLTIVDEDNPPTVAFTQATASVGEAMTSVNLSVQLSSASAFPITVPFSVGATSTADNPEDYTLASTTALSIPAGMTTAMVVVNVKADTLDEANETVVVTLGTPTNATLGATATETLTITDDDSPPTVSFTSMGSSPNEGNSNITLTVQLSDISGQDVTVPFTIGAASTALNPDDYTIAPVSPLTIPAGTTGTTITIAMKEDTVFEPDETVIVALGTPTNATLTSPSTYTLTIRDDDSPPDVSWNPAESDAAEAEGTSPPGQMTRQVTYTLVLTNASTQTVTVPIDYSGSATSGVDYTAPAMVTFAPGATTANVVLDITRDAVGEGNETITMTINAAGVMNAGTTNPTVRSYTIQNDD
jgi:hypothetical protein